MRSEEEKAKIVKEAMELAQMARAKIIPLFPPGSKLLIMGTMPSDATGSAGLFLTNYTGEDTDDLVRQLRRNMAAGEELEAQEAAHSESPDYIVLPPDGTSH